MPNNNKATIDIPLDGVGENAPRRAPATGRGVAGAGIDIPLDGLRPQKGANLGAGSIVDAELEIVNRHHAEVKELHRRAREQKR
ncbi:MAG: hypothetical protein PHO10_06855 [Gemmiger sp.]|nr:hypothetical protein [Gemmiger sp.]